MPVLVAQLENTVGGPDRYQQRMAEHLIPALAQLAVTIADDKLWKPLNYQVCLVTRNSSPMIRFAGLKTIEALYRKLRDELLILLPETVPFLAELMEDSAPQVEKQCQDLIAFIDTFLGGEESIASYFK